MDRCFRVVAIGLSLMGCSGEVAPIGVSSGGAGSTGGAGGWMSSGGAGAAAGGSSSGSTSCVVGGKDPDASFPTPTCAELAGMTLSDPKVLDESGDGIVSPGEGATITVQLSEVAGIGFNYYPGVKFTSGVATVQQPPIDAFYAILPCTSLQASGDITMPSTVTPGTLVPVGAQVVMLGMDCPDAPSIVVSIEVQ